MDTRGRVTLVFLCSFGIGAFGSMNVAFSGNHAPLDGNLTTCNNSTTNITAYTYMYKLTLGAEYVISRINIDYRHGGTDELSGFSLFLGLNCSDLSFVYQHSGPAILSTRVSLTFQANAPKVASCIGYFNNRTINSVPSGYSAHAKVDICNLEVLGCREGFYGSDCSYHCPSVCKDMCNPDNGKCLDDVSVIDQEYIEVLCPNPGYLQQSISVICVEETPSTPVISATHYSSSNTTAVCPPRLFPITSPCLGSSSDVNFCENSTVADICTIDSGDILHKSAVSCSGSEVAVKLHYRCKKVCPITTTEKTVPFAELLEANQSGALVLHYQCNPGYFSSILDVYCDSETLVWLGPFPKCERSCALTDIDKDVSNADWWSNDTHLVYTCHAGYSVQGGNLLRNCTPNGEWSGQPPSCTEITCPCLCDIPSVDPFTLNGSESLIHRIEEIKSTLTVDRRTTSKFNRSRESAPDPRLSARGVGFGVGVTILTIIIGLICIPDIPKLVQDIRFGCS
uniref:CUB and sushi domain-containing protein 3 n=1 Tax=Magallana gigas TaxID=29159 RepID=K1PYD9_MAGGI